MSELARQAAAKIERRYIGGADDDPPVIAERELLAEMIEADGVLVSHEHTALLREFKRVTPGVDAGLEHRIHADPDDVWCANVLNRKDHGVLKTAFAATPQAALKSALDAAGVPDAARMGVKA